MPDPQMPSSPRAPMALRSRVSIASLTLVSLLAAATASRAQPTPAPPVFRSLPSGQGPAPSLTPPLPAANLAPTAPVELSALTLPAAQALLLQSGRDLQTARFQLAVARAVSVAAAKRPNPTLTVGGGTAQNGFYRTRDLDSNIRIDQLIERGDKRRLRTEAADQAVQAARLDIDDTFRQSRLAVAQAYFNLKRSQEHVEIAQANVEAFVRAIDAAQKRLKAGDIAAVDLVRLQVDAGRSQNELRDARASLEGDRVTLAVLIARELDGTRIRAVDPWPDYESTLHLPDQIEAIVDQRADIRAAAARVRSAEAALRLANALRTRDVNVGVFADHNLPTNGGLIVGVQVAVPLFVNNQFQGEIARADAELGAAALAIERLRAIALGEVSRARNAFRSSAEQLQRFEHQIIPDARRAVDSAEFAYARGAIALTDLLDARRQFYGAQRELLDARASFAQAQAALEASVSSPPVPDAQR